MIKLDNRAPLSRVELLQLDIGNTSPLKRNIKISNQKFPADFFKDREKQVLPHNTPSQYNNIFYHNYSHMGSNGTANVYDFNKSIHMNGNINDNINGHSSNRDKVSIFQSMSKLGSEINIERRSHSRNLPQTHQQIRNSNYDRGTAGPTGNKMQYRDQYQSSQMRRRQMSTALEYRGQLIHHQNTNASRPIKQNQTEYEEQLIKSVLTTARQMKKIIRKHSIQLKKDRDQKIQKYKDEVQLPPLKLRRGITADF